LVDLKYISAKIHSKYASQPKIAKNSLKRPYFWGSRSFKVIDVGTTGKLVNGACYDTQQVCVYLQPFSCWIGRQYGELLEPRGSNQTLHRWNLRL